MNIGIDIRKIGERATGEETYTRELITNLINIDSENNYFLFHYKSTAELEKIGLDKILHCKNVKLISWPWGKNKIIWSLIYPFLIPWLGLDVFHAGKTASFRLWPKPKIVITLHDLSSEYPELVPMSWLDRLYQKTFMKLGAKFFASKIITVSNFSKREIVKLYNIKPEKIEAIHLGKSKLITNDQIQDADANKVLNKFNLSNDDKYLLYLGTLQPRKNIPMIIKSFNLLKKDFRFTKLKLVIAGGKAANYDSDIDVEINKSKFKNDIILTGYISEQEKSVLLKNALCFVLISLYEGFGIPILEAMSQETPCLISNKTSLPEVGGDAVVSVDPENIKSVTNGLKNLLLDDIKREELIKKGYERLEQFDWEKTARKTLLVYKSIYKK